MPQLKRMLSGVIAHISVCCQPIGIRSNLKGTRSCARICKIAAPTVRLFSYILTFLPLAMRATTVATLPSPRLVKATPPALAQKVLLLRFPFPCTYPIPLGLKTKEEPRMNQGTPKELPTTKKCFLLVYVTFWVPKSGLSDYK